VRATPVPFARAPETVRLTIAAANAAGVTRARITLRPAELGGIEMTLAHTASGLTASIVADSPQAAAALQRAADDLTRTLAQQGITLAQLDIGVAGQGSGAAAREQQRSAQHGRGPHGTAGDETGPDPLPTPTLELPGGVLVDVLA
jgi:flagellar hook-length control protein FliK